MEQLGAVCPVKREVKEVPLGNGTVKRRKRRDPPVGGGPVQTGLLERGGAVREKTGTVRQKAPG